MQRGKRKNHVLLINIVLLDAFFPHLNLNGNESFPPLKSQSVIYYNKEYSGNGVLLRKIWREIHHRLVLPNSLQCHQVNEHSYQKPKPSLGEPHWFQNEQPDPFHLRQNPFDPHKICQFFHLQCKKVPFLILLVHCGLFLVSANHNNFARYTQCLMQFSFFTFWLNKVRLW
ncbi:hypothetical protein BV102_00596 [Haemophilus influenzae]|uniref:Uncharacterized protein n=1 Tax=Haemophilus influenzae TaxID=727 RepID=A0A2S9RT41_HAEIF|nr:hypothetical protein BV102_00596 [Haemophilus influenzae]PRM19052.1 hypothetical protein BV011_00442 [Haemophilus influenzae]